MMGMLNEHSSQRRIAMVIPPVSIHDLAGHLCAAPAQQQHPRPLTRVPIRPLRTLHPNFIITIRPYVSLSTLKLGG